MTLTEQPPKLSIGERMIMRAMQRRGGAAIHRETLRTRSTDLDESSFDRSLKGLVHKQLVMDQPSIEAEASSGKKFHGVSGMITLTMRGMTMKVR